MPYKTILIDDEPISINRIKRLLKEYDDTFEIIGEALNGQEGLELIEELRPDLIFLDIEMPILTGFEMLEKLTFMPIVIFVTAYDQFAIKAFEENSIDYLLKPINPNELVDSIARFTKEKEKYNNYAILRENLKQDRLKKIAVPSGNSLLFLETEKIIFIKGEGAYSEINCENNEKYLVSRNLKNFEDIICFNSIFVRTHKSYIVNTQFIRAYNKSDGGSLELKNGLQLPLSNEKLEIILEAIEIIKR